TAAFAYRLRQQAYRTIAPGMNICRLAAGDGDCATIAAACAHAAHTYAGSQRQVERAAAIATPAADRMRLDTMGELAPGIDRTQRTDDDLPAIAARLALSTHAEHTGGACAAATAPANRLRENPLGGVSPSGNGAGVGQAYAAARRFVRRTGIAADREDATRAARRAAPIGYRMGQYAVRAIAVRADRAEVGNLDVAWRTARLAVASDLQHQSGGYAARAAAPRYGLGGNAERVQARRCNVGAVVYSDVAGIAAIASVAGPAAQDIDEIAARAAATAQRHGHHAACIVAVRGDADIGLGRDTHIATIAAETAATRAARNRGVVGAVAAFAPATDRQHADNQVAGRRDVVGGIGTRKRYGHGACVAAVAARVAVGPGTPLATVAGGADRRATVQGIARDIDRYPAVDIDSDGPAAAPLSASVIVVFGVIATCALALG